MKEIQPSKFFSDKNRNFLLFFLLITGLVLQVYWAAHALSDGKFFLIHEDEVIYYCSAKLFAETNSIQAESCIEEKVSSVGNMNWYGAGYHVIYGTLFKIFGEHPAAFPWFHAVLGFASIVIILMFPIQKELRLVAAVAVLFSHQFNVYKFTFFPENLVFFLATVLTWILILLYRSQGSDIRKFYAAFILLAILFMLVRVSFIFWLAGPIAFAANRKQLIKRTLVFIGGLGLSLFYQKVFIAPPYAPAMQKVDYLFSLDLVDFMVQTTNSTLSNIGHFLTPRASVLRLLLLYVVGAIALFWFHRSRFTLACLLIAGTLILVMAAFYYIDDFYFVKQTGMLIPLLVVGVIVGSKKVWVPFVLLFMVLITFPSPFRKVNEAIATGRSAFQHYKNHQSFQNALSQIRQQIGTDAAVILWDYREYDYGYSAEALLPFSTLGKNPIMYTTNIVDSGATQEERFKMYGRLPIDYILSRHSIALTGAKEVYTNEFYHLYRLTSKQPQVYP
ncbi:MAG TPA: hypothetical protein VGD65_05380 [Chryseosolibacter sp.]